MSIKNNKEDYKVSHKNYARGLLMEIDKSERIIMALIRKDIKDKTNQEKIFNIYKERISLITILADEFKASIKTTYKNKPVQYITEKAYLIKQEHDMTDAEFKKFCYFYKEADNIPNIPFTIMSKTLGHNVNSMPYTMEVHPSQLNILDEIITIEKENAIFNEEIKNQSIKYTDCAPSAITGKYNSLSDKSLQHTNSVIGALFLPKYSIIDSLMLHTSIAKIVKNRYNNIPLDVPNKLLYENIIYDPSENARVSVNKSPLIDLRDRAKIQIELWKIVKDLREGKYYSNENITFEQSISNRSYSAFDSPDLLNVRDEGNILRKLLNVFALRPTHISISTLNTGAYSNNHDITQMEGEHYTNIPIINVRIPQNMNLSKHINITDALTQPEWFVDNKIIVQKIKSVKFSREIAIFYVNRRTHYVSNPFNHSQIMFNILPSNQDNSFEQINPIPVIYNIDGFNIGDDYYKLRSVVLAEWNVVNNIITGSSVGIVMKPNKDGEQEHIIFNPSASTYKFENSVGIITSNDPVSFINGRDEETTPDGPTSFYSRAITSGTIYIFANEL